MYFLILILKIIFNLKCQTRKRKFNLHSVLESHLKKTNLREIKPKMMKRRLKLQIEKKKRKFHQFKKIITKKSKRAKRIKVVKIIRE